MNLLHLKYAVEVAKHKSINKAAESLYMNQPNLSRALKELEENLGITIFNRTPRGISVTPEGDEFLHFAANILRQVAEIETFYREGAEKKQKFSVSVPRASYISAAFVEFSKHIDKARPAEILYKETNTIRTINNVADSDYNLGIIRYRQIFEDRFAAMLEEKGLRSELICEFDYMAVMSKNNPLAAKKNAEPSDLAGFIEIAHADPSVSASKASEDEHQEEADKHIFVFERGSQFDLLQNVPDTFMWVSPIPQQTLDKYNLTQLSCRSGKKTSRDMLIWRKDYTFSELDGLFREKVGDAARGLSAFSG